MNSFDLDIAPVNVPSDVAATAGSQALRELTTLQTESDKTSRRLTPRRFLTAICRALTGYDAGNAPFTMASGRSGIAIS